MPVRTIRPYKEHVKKMDAAGGKITCAGVEPPALGSIKGETGKRKCREAAPAQVRRTASQVSV